MACADVQTVFNRLVSGTSLQSICLLLCFVHNSLQERKKALISARHETDLVRLQKRVFRFVTGHTRAGRTFNRCVAALVGINVIAVILEVSVG